MLPITHDTLVVGNHVCWHPLFISKDRSREIRFIVNIVDLGTGVLCGRRPNSTIIPVIRSVIRQQGQQTMEPSTRHRWEWIAAINCKNEPTKKSAVCSDHFITGRAAKLYDIANPDWVPSLLMSSAKRWLSNSGNSLSKKRKLDRYKRVQKRTAIREQLTAAQI